MKQALRKLLHQADDLRGSPPPEMSSTASRKRKASTLTAAGENHAQAWYDQEIDWRVEYDGVTKTGRIALSEGGV